MERQPTEIIGLRSLSYLTVFVDDVFIKYLITIGKIPTNELGAGGTGVHFKINSVYSMGDRWIES